ncbi:hypothetical protein [Halorubrum sp. N11]|uniref:hypothetical protein n=1 Tax=Halorubrum sp. N11 TaxID=3402276 RepID=UPI003EBE57F3
MTGDNDESGRRTSLTHVALGETGFERAAVWSAVGFAVSYVAFDAVGIAADAAALLGGGAVPETLAAAVAGLLAISTAVGVVAFAAVGGGVLPAVLLAYGPFAAVLLRTTGPEPYSIPVVDPVPFLAALLEALGIAGAAAVAVGVAGYAVGRVIAGIGSNERDRESTPPDESADASD